MICESCKEFFAPTDAEDKLISTGAVPRQCITCAKKSIRALTEANNVHKPISFYPGHEPYDGGVTVYRIVEILADGTQGRHMHLPISPKAYHIKPLRKPQPGNVHVQVFGESGTSFGEGEHSSTHTIMHNLMRYDVLRPEEELWFRRIPSYSDPVLGCADIKVHRNVVKEIVTRGLNITIHLNDGRMILVFKK